LARAGKPRETAPRQRGAGAPLRGEAAPPAEVEVTPAALGYRMPAEWELHEATWLAWPHERTDWPGKFAPIPWVYADIVRHLARVERVRILVQDRAEERAALRILQKTGADLSAVDFFVAPTNRGWTRDFGAIFVKKCGTSGTVTPGCASGAAGTIAPDVILRSATPGSPARVKATRAGVGATKNLSGASSVDREILRSAQNDITGAVAATKWRFNAWAKYDDWHKDDAAMRRVLPKLKMRTWEPQYRGRAVVLEGGSIEVNGLGSLLTTEECLLSAEQARNPGFTRADWEAIFRDYLGATNVLWLGRGITGDDTHGHVDDLARFVNPTTVVTVVESDRSDANYEPLQENLARLREIKDRDGQPLHVETLPMPQPVWFDGQRLPASYANFYIANKIVLVPTFSDPADRIALNTLAALFPDREVIGIAARDLILGLGTLHCMTQQQPA
jgi:agmatine deiminase